MRLLRVPLNSAVGATSIVAALLAWELLSRTGLINSFYFSSPSVIWGTLIELYTSGYPDGITVARHVVASLQRIVAGFIIASLVGIPLGLLIGSSRALYLATNPFITFGRSIAAISLLPLFIAWFGIGELSKVMLISLSTFWVILAHTVGGVRMVDQTLIRAARSLDTGQMSLFFAVVFPAALPRIFTGLKIGLSVAFMVIVAAEMIATVLGLGALIQEARNTFRTDVVMAGMIIIGVIGWFIAWSLDQLEKRLLPWRVEIV